MYNSCNTYEISKSPDRTAKSLKISQLKSQLLQLEQDDKAYNDLLQKYRQLQNEYQLVNEAKLHLEYELKQKNESNNKILCDLKCQNCDLTSELNEKNSIYKKLYADNTNLFRNLEDRKKENENLINRLYSHNGEYKHKIILEDKKKEMDERIGKKQTEKVIIIQQLEEHQSFHLFLHIHSR